MVIILIHEGLLNAAFALHKTDTDSKPPSTFCETYKTWFTVTLVLPFFSACHLVFLPVCPSPWFDHDMGSQLQTWPSSRQCGGCLRPWWIHGYIYLGVQVPVARKACHGMCFYLVHIWNLKFYLKDMRHSSPLLSKLCITPNLC